MPVAIQIPNVRPDEAIGAAELASMLKRVEEVGFDSAWVMEHSLGKGRALDPFSVLAFAAGQTRSISLGIAVAVLATHQPVHLARQAATIDYLSNGRMMLGVGIGAPVLQYEAFGASVRERAPRFEEDIEVMRRLWRDTDIDFDGRFVKLQGANMEPKPVQSPLPVWFGASSSAALKRTAKLADAWMGAGSSPASAFPGMVSKLREYLDAEGRDPNAFPIGKRAYVAIDRPQQEVDDWFQAVYGGGISPDVAFVGSAGEVVEELLKLREAGAETLLISPVGDDAAQLGPVIEHVLPAVR
jgi:probable F420-dependent oxidoreductase